MRPRVIQLLLAAVAVAYVAWSQIALHGAKAALESERRRVYSIADYAELWKEVALRDGGRLDPAALAKDPRHVRITETPSSDATARGLPLASGDRLHTLTYDPPDPARRSRLDRYFSELVLHNYFYVVTNERSQIKDMFWDKP